MKVILTTASHRGEYGVAKGQPVDVDGEVADGLIARGVAIPAGPVEAEEEQVETAEAAVPENAATRTKKPAAKRSKKKE